MLAVMLVHARSPKTNFVIVIADDLGWGDVGFHQGIARTPNLDAMAASPNALLLNNMHSAIMCAPSRAMIETGLHAERVCVSGLGTSTFALPNQTLTLGNDATLAGYRTGFFGKWHITEVSRTTLSAQFGYQNFTATQGNLLSFNSTCLCGVHDGFRSNCGGGGIR